MGTGGETQMTCHFELKADLAWTGKIARECTEEISKRNNDDS